MDKKRLFIIGNGFDLHHGLETNYDNYKRYLEKHCTKILSDISSIYNQLGITYLEEDLWSDMESRISDAYSFLINKYFISSSCDENSIVGNRLLDKLNEIMIPFTGELFISWLHDTYKLNISKCMPELQNAISDSLLDSLFINFNYTQTLEDVYNVKRADILYVHGDIKTVMDRQEELGSNCVIPDNNLTQARIEFGASDVRLEPIIDVLNNDNMNTEDKITLSATPTKHMNNKIGTIRNILDGNSFEKVVIIGHSLAGDDLKYYDEIIIPKCIKAKWIVYYFDDKDRTVKETFLSSKGIEDYTLKTYKE